MPHGGTLHPVPELQIQEVLIAAKPSHFYFSASYFSRSAPSQKQTHYKTSWVWETEKSKDSHGSGSEKTGGYQMPAALIGKFS